MSCIVDFFFTFLFKPNDFYYVLKYKTMEFKRVYFIFHMTVYTFYQKKTLNSDRPSKQEYVV